MKYRIFVSQHGNSFMTEIASLIWAAFADLDLDAELVREGLPIHTADAVNLVVAPHEYFILLDAYPARKRLESARYCIPIAVEQPGASWFEAGFPYCRQAPFVLDISRVGAAAFRERGVEAYHFPLGYHRSWDVWGGDQGRAREIDILFMGALSPKREAFLARHAGTFAALNCRFNITDPAKPLVETKANFVVGEERHRLLADAKVLLNVHQSDNQYFEWHRSLAAMANGCLVITEPSTGYSPLQPFTHFIEAPLDLLPDYALSLVMDNDLRQGLTEEAYRFITQQLDLTRMVEGFLPLLEAHAGRPKSGWVQRPRSYSPSPAGQGHPGLVARSRRLVRNLGRQMRDRMIRPLKSDLDRLQDMQPRLKTLMLNQIALKRKLESLEAQIAFGDDAEYDIAKTPAFDAITPDLTVVIPLYNYEQYIEECLESVLATVGVLPEILVINDHSLDGSEKKVRNFLATHEDLPIALVSHRANRGLSQSRNTGFRLARSEYVFLLDADNLVYPDALRKLKAALLQSGAQFTYCMAERFGEATGLISCYPWELDRLVRGNYIDAMCLITRSAWAAVGGFSSDMDERFGGWEDYALWLAFAEHGFSGVMVPEILVRYRVHPGSLLSLVNLETESISQYLRARYGGLPWPQAENPELSSAAPPGGPDQKAKGEP